MNGWSWYWLCWFATSVITFAVPEVYVLINSPNDTLSDNVWRLEQALPGQPIWQWTAVHFLVGGLIAVVLTWLLFHFLFAIWQ